jgi:polyisoprenoid-binding protein YceI
MKKSAFALAFAALVTGNAFAAPVTYKIDPAHSYPAFEADHFGGMSLWRGKFTRSSGTLVYDKDARSGTVEVTIETKSIDMGLDAMNEHAVSPDLLDAAKYPTATFKGKLAKFNGDKPTEVQGQLTLHGVTKPVTLKVSSFQCRYIDYTKKDTCGAEASATINREAFGITYGKDLGFRMEVVLRIGVEGHKAS